MLIVPFLILLPAILAAIIPQYQLISQFIRSKKNKKGCVVYIKVPNDGSCHSLERIVSSLYLANESFYGPFEKTYINTRLSIRYNLISVFLPILPEHIDELSKLTDRNDVSQRSDIGEKFLSKFYPKKFSSLVAKVNIQKISLISKTSVSNMKFTVFSKNVLNAFRNHEDFYGPIEDSIPQKRLYADKAISNQVSEA